MMQKTEAWKYPSWSMTVVLKTNPQAEIYEVLQKVQPLHQEGMGYSWSYGEPDHEVTFYAHKPKFIASQVFFLAVKNLRKNPSVSSVKTANIVNLFHGKTLSKST